MSQATAALILGLLTIIQQWCPLQNSDWVHNFRAYNTLYHHTLLGIITSLSAIHIATSLNTLSEHFTECIEHTHDPCVYHWGLSYILPHHWTFHWVYWAYTWSLCISLGSVINTATSLCKLLTEHTVHITVQIADWAFIVIHYNIVV